MNRIKWGILFVLAILLYVTSVLVETISKFIEILFENISSILKKEKQYERKD